MALARIGLGSNLGDSQATLERAVAALAGLGEVTVREMAQSIHQAILEGKDEPFALGSYAGPVSVNPTGICEGGYYSLFDPGSPQARWNSFNVGEFWFPGSRWSVVPFLGFAALLGVWLAAGAGEARRTALADVVDGMRGEEVAAD